MKFAALAFAVILLGALAHADVIEAGTHPIEKCVKMTWDAEGASDYAFIGAISPITSNGQVEFVPIENGFCINAGTHYKFDRFEIYYAKSSYISRVGLLGIKTAPVDDYGHMGVSDENVGKVSMLSLESISAPYAPYYVSDSDGSKSVAITYNIYPCRGTFCINKQSEVKSPDPIDPDLINREAPKPGEPGDSPPSPPGRDVPSGSGNVTAQDVPPSPPGDDVPPSPPGDDVPQPAAANPFQSFICWLVGIFGGKC